MTSTLRTVHAIRVQLHSVADRSVIIWLKDSLKLCVHLMNPRRTWTTARAGDAVILNSGGVKSREYIERMELYRVFPASCNGQMLECAWTWLDSGAVMRGRAAVS
ncbi:MAG: hypothetical protein R3C17_19125 [Planctomycetaceae bacterium]